MTEAEAFALMQKLVALCREHMTDAEQAAVASLLFRLLDKGKA